MRKVMVLGATGKLGTRVLQKLLGAKIYSLGILVRKKQAITLQPENKVTIFYGDILNALSIEECIKWADIVINCTGKVGYKKKDKKSIYLINYVGTKNVLAACEKYDKKLIHTSSACIYGYSDKPVPFSEPDTSLKSVIKVKSMYYTSKFDAEMMVLSSNISKIVMRPSSFIAKEKSTLKLLSSIIKKGFFPSLNGGASFVLTEDVACAYVKAVALVSGSDRSSYVFNLGGNNLSFKEVLQSFQKLHNKTCIKIPYLLLLFIGYLSDYILDYLTKGTGITSESVRLSNRYSYIDSGKAQHMLGYKITSFDDTLNEIL